MTIRKIRFRQTGGFAGLVRGCEIAPEDLSAKDRAELTRLVEKSGLAEKKTGAAKGAAGPARDLVGYEIEIETDAGTAKAHLDDLDLPEAAAPLVDWLQKRAKPVPLK